MRGRCHSRAFAGRWPSRVDQVVTGQTLVSRDTSAIENRQGEPWESSHVDLVRHQTRHRVDGIVVSQFDVGQM